MSQDDFMTPAAFGRLIGITKQGVAKAIKVGRVPVYDETFSRVAPDYKGRKFIKCEEGARAFRLSRARIDDRALAEANAEIKQDLDPMRSYSEEEFLVARQHLEIERERHRRMRRIANAAVKEIKGLPEIAEDVVEAARAGGVEAVEWMLKFEVFQMLESIKFAMNDVSRS